MLAKWAPKITRLGSKIESVGDPKQYEYGPSVQRSAAGVPRMWCCAGLGTDTISSVNLSSGVSESWSLSGWLVADPAAFRIVDQWLLLYTYAGADGKNNGVGYHWQDTKTLKHSRHQTLIQRAKGHPLNPYGVGQPAIVARPGCPTLLFTTTTVDGYNRLQAHFLNIGGPGDPVTLGAQIPISGGNDGASVDGFWLDEKTVLLAQSDGSNYVGVRLYELEDGTLHRLLGEYVYQGFHARHIQYVPGVIDGVGITRGVDQQPIWVDAGKVEAWVASGDRLSPGTWQLRPIELQVR